MVLAGACSHGGILEPAQGLNSALQRLDVGWRQRLEFGGQRLKAQALAAFWFCVDAFGETLSPSVLVGGFTTGVALGFVSFVPGGLGVQEGTQAATLAILGVQLEHAALAAVLFRVVCYFLPFVISIPFYRALVRAKPSG